MVVGQKTIQKISKTFLGDATPAKKGILPTAVLGTGFEVAMKSVDAVFGSPVQRIFSFNLPVFGAVGLIDVINFMAFSNGLKNVRGGVTAVLGAKILQGGITSVGSVVFPGQAAPGAGQAQAAVQSGIGF